MMVFGDGWPSWHARLPKAPPLICLYCDQPIEPYDDGLVLPWSVDEDSLAYCAYHRECMLRSLGLGTVR